MQRSHLWGDPRHQRDRIPEMDHQESGIAIGRQQQTGDGRVRDGALTGTDQVFHRQFAGHQRRCRKVLSSSAKQAVDRRDLGERLNPLHKRAEGRHRLRGKQVWGGRHGNRVRVVGPEIRKKPLEPVPIRSRPPKEVPGILVKVESRQSETGDHRDRDDQQGEEATALAYECRVRVHGRVYTRSLTSDSRHSRPNTRHSLIRMNRLTEKRLDVLAIVTFGVAVRKTGQIKKRPFRHFYGERLQPPQEKEITSLKLPTLR